MAAAERKQISVPEEAKAPPAAGASEPSASTEPPKDGPAAGAPPAGDPPKEEPKATEYVVVTGQSLSGTHRGQINEGEGVEARDLVDPAYFDVLVERGTIVVKGT